MSIAELASIGIVVDVPLPDDGDVTYELEDGSELNFNDGE